MWARRSVVQALLVTVGGCLYFLGFVGFGLTPLIAVCLVPPLFAIRDATPGRAFGLGIVLGWVTNLGGYYWVIHLLDNFTGLDLPWVFLGYQLLCVFQGFLLAPLLYGVRRFERDLGLAPVWTLPVLFVALERVYPFIFPSFIGDSLYRLSWLTQVVELTGVPGLTALIGLTNGAVFELLRARTERRPLRRARVVVPVAALAACLLYGAVRLPQLDARIAAARPLRVALVQANLGARDKKERREEFARRHVEMTRAVIARVPDLDLVVWPEGALANAAPRAQTDFAPELAFGVPLVVGATTVATGPGAARQRFNSALLVSASGQLLDRYDKTELLAFGERVPGADVFPSLQKLLPARDTFVAGTELSHLDLGGTPLLPLVCYEDVLPPVLRRLWSAAGPAAVLVNLTNDSWYGQTQEPAIHLALATFRSIETRRALIRATNTGISAIVDPAGRIVARTGEWTQETLVARVPLFEDGSTTPYLVLGDWLSSLALALVGLAALASLRRGLAGGSGAAARR